VAGCAQRGGNLVVYAPLGLPYPYARLARRVNQAILLRMLRHWLRAGGGRRPILWTFLPTPPVLDLIH
jgi:hypothetical protein